MTANAALSTEEIYQRLRAAILDGELEAGSVMSQVALAESIGVSRTPLREALRMLQAEGLIEAERGRRVRVAAMTPADLEELYIIRITLEAEALRISVPLLESDAIAELEGHMAAMAHYAGEKDYRQWVDPHRKFHRAHPSSRRARQRAARPALRPRRALPTTAHRLRTERMGDV